MPTIGQTILADSSRAYLAATRVGTVYDDASPLNADGTLVGGPSYAYDATLDRYGLSLTPSQYASIGVPLSFYAAFSVACWVRLSTSSAAGMVLAQRSAEEIGWWELIQRSGNVLRFEVKANAGANNEFYSPNAALALGELAHVCGTFDGSRVRIWKNGVQAGSGAAYSGSPPAPTVAAAVGSISGDTPLLGITGNVYDPLIVPRLLTPDEITWLADPANSLLASPSSALASAMHRGAAV